MPELKYTKFITEVFITLQVPNSLGDKFSQNETLITHYVNKNRNHAKWFLILRKSCLTENISNTTLNFISK